MKTEDLNNVESVIKNVTLTGPFNYVKSFLVMRGELIGLSYRDACDFLVENGFEFLSYNEVNQTVEYGILQRNKRLVIAKLEISSENA